MWHEAPRERPVDYYGTAVPSASEVWMRLSVVVLWCGVALRLLNECGISL